ncbi:unnamed protein product [Tetraodon nigroviridis]|uniref:Receptor for retinol uptake STRA6 n=1 Tax=Tetraodon nigroviridis TaxID=99883 RepID=Q4T0V5_TETNG|nr:unnamed protein product [Tetraodon nigroviridis]
MNQSQVDAYEYSYYDYTDEAEPTTRPKEVILPCDPTVDDALFHTCVLSLSLVMVLILAVLCRKNKLCQGFTRGSSSVFSPANFLDQSQNKGAAMAVFGLVFSKLATLTVAPDPLPFCKDTPAEIKEYMKVAAIFYYPLLFYPLLLCNTLQRKVGYVFGTLLSFTHLVVLLWQKVDCPRTPEIYKYYSLLASLPQLACLAFLCVQFLLLSIKGPKTEEVRGRRPSSIAHHRLLLWPLLQRPSQQLFRFPLKLAVSAFVAFLAIYHTALLLVVTVVPTLHIVRAGIDENIAFLLLSFGIVLSEDRMEVVQIVTFYTWLLEVCYLCAATLSCLVHLIMLMKSMILHRSNLKGLYKGDVYSLYNSQKTISPSKPGIVCWMGLTGYQAAVVSLGMAIQTVVFFICFLFLVFLVIVPVFYRRNLIVFEVVEQSWPAWVTLLLVTALQHVLAKFAFIKKEAGTRDLNNSLQVLHTLPEGGSQPVSPGDEGFLRPAAGPDGGGWSRWAEDKGRRRSLLLRDFRDPAKQGDQPAEDPLALAAALHPGQQPFAAGLQEALPDPADLREHPERDPQSRDQLVGLAAVFVHQVETHGAQQRNGGHGEETDADRDDDEKVGDSSSGGEQHLDLAVVPFVGQAERVIGVGTQAGESIRVHATFDPGPLHNGVFTCGDTQVQPV